MHRTLGIENAPIGLEGGKHWLGALRGDITNQAAIFAAGRFHCREMVAAGKHSLRQEWHGRL